MYELKDFGHRPIGPHYMGILFGLGGLLVVGEVECANGIGSTVGNIKW